MTRPRPFEGVFGNTCELRLLEFLLALDDMEFNITELSEEAEVSRVTVGRVVRKFVKWDILIATNDRIPQYSINPASSIVRSLEIVNNSLIGQMLGDEKVREMQDYVRAKIPVNHHTKTDTQKEQVWPQVAAPSDANAGWETGEVVANDSGNYFPPVPSTTAEVYDSGFPQYFQ